jgi:hypothetical protein
MIWGRKKMHRNFLLHSTLHRTSAVSLKVRRRANGFFGSDALHEVCRAGMGAGPTTYRRAVTDWNTSSADRPVASFTCAHARALECSSSGNYWQQFKMCVEQSAKQGLLIPTWALPPLNELRFLRQQFSNSSIVLPGRETGSPKAWKYVIQELWGRLLRR